MKRYLYLTPPEIINKTGSILDNLLYSELIQKPLNKLLELLTNKKRCEDLVKRLNPLERKILGFWEENPSSFWYSVLRNIHAGGGASFGPIVEKILEIFIKNSGLFDNVERGKDVIKLIGEKGTPRKIDFFIEKKSEVFFIELRQSVETGGGTSRGSLFDKLKILINKINVLSKKYDRITYGIVSLFDENGSWTEDMSSPRWISLENKLKDVIEDIKEMDIENTTSEKSKEKWIFFQKDSPITLNIVFYSAKSWFNEFLKKDPEEFIDDIKIYMDFSILYESIIRRIDHPNIYDSILDVCSGKNIPDDMKELLKILNKFYRDFVNPSIDNIDTWTSFVEETYATILSELTNLYGHLSGQILKNLSYICLYVFIYMNKK